MFEEELEASVSLIESGWERTTTPQENETKIGDIERDRLKSALADRLREEDEDALAEILDRCGDPMDLHCTCCGSVHTVPRRCKKRWCPVCARRISAKRTARYSAAVDSMQWPLFVTLTRRNVRRINLEVIQHLRRSFRRLRQRKIWGTNVVGGVASIEITNTGKGWHPHLHAVIDCRWLAHKTPPPKPFESRETKQRKFKQAGKELAEVWAQCLGEAKAVVHVKRAYGSGSTRDRSGHSDSIAVEVLKYSVKTDDLLQAKDKIGGLLRLLGAARLVSSWGSCYGKKLVVHEEDREPQMCECGAIGHWIPGDVVDRMTQRHVEENHLIAPFPVPPFSLADG